MIPERVRILQPYVLAALVLVGGGVWFLRAAPYLGEDQRVQAWRATVIRELPDVQPQIEADTVMLGRGTDREASVSVVGGSFTLAMVCAGVGRVRVRLGPAGNDTGAPVPCADQPRPVLMTIGLGPEFYLSMTAETEAAVFRWRLTPTLAD